MSISGKLPHDLQQSFDAEKKKGNDAYREARYQDAVTHYNEAEIINPMSPIPPANRSMVYIKLAQFEKAKQEAAIAHELHQALPTEERSDKLLAKILLRRATANKQLLLLALAAEDYQAVLDIEDNHVAKNELAALKAKYNLNPTPRRAAFTERSSEKKIQVVSEDENAISLNASIAHIETDPKPYPSSRSSQSPLPPNVQDETALVQLPKSVLEGLVSKWSATPPRSSDEFERVWRSLHQNTLARAKYLIETVGPVCIENGILGENITPQLLEQFVSVLTAAVEHNPAVSTKVSVILQALTSISRFDMLLMFLSSEEKKPIEKLLQSLRANNVPPSDMHLLETSYA